MEAPINPLPLNLRIKDISQRIQEATLQVDFAFEKGMKDNYISFMQEILFDLSTIEDDAKRLEQKLNRPNMDMSGVPHETM
jgi:hypothetical protein